MLTVKIVTCTSDECSICMQNEVFYFLIRELRHYFVNEGEHGNVVNLAYYIADVNGLYYVLISFS